MVQVIVAQCAKKNPSPKIIPAVPCGRASTAACLSVELRPEVCPSKPTPGAAMQDVSGTGRVLARDAGLVDDMVEDSHRILQQVANDRTPTETRWGPLEWLFLPHA